ncbi:MAG: hypothetical protein IPM71_15730 [Bacteroidota bacterium]|nr:MAG: hypothetical protein IPM71_15730 [Bacteroidota bacterium]
MIKKIIDRFALVLWIILSATYLLSLFTSIEISSLTLRNICFLTTISGLILIILRLLKIKLKENIYRIVIFSSILIGGFVITWFKWTGDWKTQTIIYENGHISCKTIEFQMHDKGALGYNKRIVEVTKLTGFLKLIEPIDTADIGLPWIKVDKEINELKIKY